MDRSAGSVVRVSVGPGEMSCVCAFVFECGFCMRAGVAVSERDLRQVLFKRVGGTMVPGW